MKLLLMNVPSIVCFSLAGALILCGRDGWGWFLLIGLLMGHVLRNTGVK